MPVPVQVNLSGMFPPSLKALLVKTKALFAEERVTFVRGSALGAAAGETAAGVDAHALVKAS